MFMKQFQIFSVSLMAALVVMGLAVWFVILPPSGDRLAAPPLLLVVAQVVAGALVHLFCETVGYRMQPVQPGLRRKAAATQAITRYQSAMIVRFAMIELIAVASLVVAFVVTEGGFLGYVTGAAVSEILMAVHVFPWSRPVDRSQEVLEKRGEPSYLRELFGLDPWTGTEDDRPGIAGDRAGT